MAFKVFISYSTNDLPVVNHVRSLLEGSSIEVFVAEYSVDPGEPLPSKIKEAIHSCNLFLLMWSNNSKDSEWVSQEIGIAASCNKNIIPVLLETGLHLPGFINNLKYLNAYKNPEGAMSWLRENVYRQAQEKEKADGLVWLGLGAAFVWLASRS